MFLRTKTSRMHYLQILQEMKFIKDMPISSLPPMADWILSCEDKRNKSKNINGMVTRQMREYLIKLKKLHIRGNIRTERVHRG